MTDRFQYFFNDYVANIFAPPFLVQKIVTNLKCKLYKTGELIVQRGDFVSSLHFLYFGVGHLYGFFEYNDEQLRTKVVTLKKGSWFGDYQIMLNTRSTWDLEAGDDSEFNGRKRPKAMPSNHVMVYSITAEKLKKILDKYPTFRSHVVTRSVLRRSHYRKMMNENINILLLNQKQNEQESVARAHGIKNDFIESESDSELQKPLDLNSMSL